MFPGFNNFTVLYFTFYAVTFQNILTLLLLLLYLLTNPLMGYMTTEFGRKCKHDTLIQKNGIRWTGYVNSLRAVSFELRSAWN